MFWYQIFLARIKRLLHLQNWISGGLTKGKSLQAKPSKLFPTYAIFINAISRGKDLYFGQFV